MSAHLPNFSFKPLQESDLELLCLWLDKPHVKEWWPEHLSHAEIKEKYRKRIGNKIVVSFIIYAEQTPIGYIQYYHADQVGGGWWPEATVGTIGIDQYIGAEDYVNRGYGTHMLRAFIQQLFTHPDINKIITDVDPTNHRAIRCYEKAGFKAITQQQTPFGLALIMTLDRQP